MIDLIAIRARDEDDYATAEVLRNIQWAGNTDPELTATINMVADRHALLAAYDALAAENARLRAQIAEMQTWAKTTDEKIRAKINADLEAVRNRVAEVEQHLRQLHAEHVATWNTDKAKVERAIADLKEGRDKASAELAEGRAKAKAELK